MLRGCAIAHPLLVLGAATGCSPAAFVPALTFGTTAVVREHTPPGTDPLTVRAGAWMTWRVKARAGAVHETPAGEASTAATGVQAGAPDPHADRATPEPVCAVAAACAWAVTARQDALGRFDERDALDAEEATP